MSATSAAADGDWTPVHSAAGARDPWLIVVILSLATFMEVLDTSVANISLAHIGGDMSADYDETTWILTSYLVANAIIVPLSGWLSDVIGRKRYYMISVALFTAASLACAMAPSLNWLIVFRVLQGLGGGGLAPCEQSMLIDTFPPASRGKAIAAYGVVLVFGPAFGPSIGGLITDAASWRWIFLINIPVGLVSLVLVRWLVTEPPALGDRRRRRLAARGRIDLPGFALVAVGFGCLQMVIDRGQAEDWFNSTAISGLAIAAGTSLAVLLARELRTPNPVIDFRLFRRPGFAAAGALMAATGATLYATTQIVPQFLQQEMGYTAAWAGIAMTASSMATLVVTGATAALSNRVSAWKLILTGIMVEVAGLVHTTQITDRMGFWTMAADRVWLVAGLPLILAPLTTGAYSTLSAEDTGQASAFLNLFRNLGGAAGISAAQTVLARRAPIHEARLADRVSAGHWRWTLERAGAALHPLWRAEAAAPARAVALAWAALRKQAMLLAYIDVFWVLAAFTALTAPLVWFLRKSRT